MKRFAMPILAVLLTVVVIPAFATTTWQFTRVTWVPCSGVSEAVFRCELRSQNGPETIHLMHHELLPFVIHYGVEKPEQLAGKTFSSEKVNLSQAIAWCATHLNARPRGQVLGKWQIYDRVARALSRDQAPNLLSVDPDSVFAAFRDAFDSQGYVRQDWLAKIAERVYLYSGKRVALLRAEPWDPPNERRHKAYLSLVDSNRVRRVIIKASATPVYFPDSVALPRATSRY